MKRSMAVKAFFEKDSTREKISPTEFMQFWKTLSEPERADYGQQAAQQLGVELETE